MNFADIDKCLTGKKVNLAVCMPEGLDSVAAAYEAASQGFVNCIFVGNDKLIRHYIECVSPGFEPQIINCETPEEAAFKTVELVREHKADAIMKGNISTPIFLKAVLNRETGIKASKVLSHVLVFEWQNSLRFLTDGGMIPSPTLEDKIEMINSTKLLAQKFGVEVPRVAVLSSLEKVNPKIVSTIDAAVLAKMSERKQFGSDCIVEGPLALDNAISVESAHHKGIYNEVAGKADILLVPDIDAGNVLGKIIINLANVPAGGVIIGAKCPVIMLSRADSKQTRLNSIKVALAAANLP